MLGLSEALDPGQYPPKRKSMTLQDRRRLMINVRISELIGNRLVKNLCIASPRVRTHSFLQLLTYGIRAEANQLRWNIGSVYKPVNIMRIGCSQGRATPVRGSSSRRGTEAAFSPYAGNHPHCACGRN